MAKPDFSKKNSFFRKFSLVPQRNLYLRKNLAWGTEEIFLKKFGFAILIALKNQSEKWSPFFYLLGTKKYPEMFLMPFYATGPFESKQSKQNKKNRK